MPLSWEAGRLTAPAAGFFTALAFLLLRGAAAPWWLSLAAVCAATGLSRLLGTWCAQAPLGLLLTVAAAAAGIAAQAPAGKTEEDSSLALAATAGTMLAAIPLLLRFLGLNAASPDLLENPIGSLASAAFTLGQACLLASLAAAAAARSARGLARPAGSAARAAPTACALAAGLGVHLIEPSVLLAGAGAFLCLASVLHSRPWSIWRERPLRARAMILAPLLALALASRAPRLMKDVWTARLDAAYPGGRFLFFRDDGRSVLAAYEFSNRDRTVLRDGVLQADDASAKIAVVAAVGQNALANGVLLVHPPTPAAADVSLPVLLEEKTRADSEVLDALGRPGWRDLLRAIPPGEKPRAAAVFLSRPFGLRDAQRLPATLKALRARLDPEACASILLPPLTQAPAVALAESAARGAFGRTRTADIGRSVLVMACGNEVETDPIRLFVRLPDAERKADPPWDRVFAARLLWRAAPTPTGK